MIHGWITGIPVELRGVEPSASRSDTDARSYRHVRPPEGAHSLDGAIPGHGRQTTEMRQEAWAVINRSYSRLGNLLATLAAERRASNPCAIAKRIQEATGYAVSHRMISDYLYGADFPGPKFMRAFAKAFSLTVEESRKLAWIYTFAKLPHQGLPEKR